MNVSIHADDKKLIKSVNDLYPIMQKILLRQNKVKRKKGYYWLVGLENDHTLSFVELMAIGVRNFVSIKKVHLFHLASIKRISKLILVHNRPSGSLEFSESDLEITRDLRQAAYQLDIYILDHMIISEEDYSLYSVAKGYDK